MSDRMQPLSFGQLMHRALREYRDAGRIFGVRPYRHACGKSLPIFGGRIETPFGPAAGPHTQLSQNLVAAYAGGGRFFELKTVQALDGEDLPVAKPCILASDEGYNVEWSTELRVSQAMAEYIRAWWAIKLLGRELALGDPDGFVFNMSVGYDFEGITSPKIDAFIEGMRRAGQSEAWRECFGWTMEHLHLFARVDESFARSIGDGVCASITLSTLHGCPPREIERIASYLIVEKKLHTCVKCNPTLLGYDFAREVLGNLGYRLSFDAHHFESDLQYADAVPMFSRLLALAAQNGVEFGLKLTNTFPVRIQDGELPGEEMYMSGRALYPLSISLTRKLEHSFGGKLRVSYSGGADARNIADIVSCGVWPVTMATTLLKPGGYERMRPIAAALSTMEYAPFAGVDLQKLDRLAGSALSDPLYKKPLKPLPAQKMPGAAPLLNCFTAPCASRCPLHQDIPQYLALNASGRYEEALAVILRKNPLPFITGTICSHRCTVGCARNFYEAPVDIRGEKLRAAREGMAALLPKLAPGPARPERVAVVGAGPGGMAAAFLLARGGARVTLFEKRDKLGGAVRYAIPAFRIGDAAIDRDAAMLQKLGVEIVTGEAVSDPLALLKQGYTHVVVAVGAGMPGRLRLAKGAAVDAISFLEEAKARPQTTRPGKSVAVVGGGNTAMDAARSAIRLPGVEKVFLLYRRTIAQMPADGRELELALQEGVRFMELISPLSHEGGVLTCEKMALGAPDESGRKSPQPTGETLCLPVDTVVAAVGEGVDGGFLSACGVSLDGKGRALRAKNGRLYLVGDCLRGPSTVAEAIADAGEAAADILGQAAEDLPFTADVLALREKRGRIACPGETPEGERCLGCPALCENCVETCPNRANVEIQMPDTGRIQIVHLDALCNECGNCAAFCPYEGGPYHDKFTLFSSPEAFAGSRNQGFLPLGGDRVRVRLDGDEYEETLASPKSPAPLACLMRTVIARYPDLI